MTSPVYPEEGLKMASVADSAGADLRSSASESAAEVDQIERIARFVVEGSGQYAFAYTERGALSVVRKVLTAAWPMIQPAAEPDQVQP